MKEKQNYSEAPQNFNSYKSKSQKKSDKKFMIKKFETEKSYSKKKK